MLFLLTKLPREVSLCCFDPAAPLQQFAVSLTKAIWLFVERSVSQTLDTVQGKKKTPRKKGFCPCFCLFVCSLTQISLIWSTKQSHKQLCWHVSMSTGAGIKKWRVMEERQLLLPLRSAYHVTNPNSSLQQCTKTLNLLNYLLYLIHAFHCLNILDVGVFFEKCFSFFFFSLRHTDKRLFISSKIECQTVKCDFKLKEYFKFFM